MDEITVALLDQIADISQKQFQKISQEPGVHKIGEFTTGETIKYLASYINSLRSVVETKVVQFLGSPGSGKSKMVNFVVPKLESLVVLATDDYNIGTRQDRRKIIAGGGTPLEEKDFSLLASHVQALKHLPPDQSLYLPEAYDSNTGDALIRGLTRGVTGPIRYILIDGNFYVGEGGASNIPLDCLVYFHMSDRNRLHVRLIRDLTEGQVRGRDANEILEQFISRQKLQDEQFTVPFMSEANLIVEARPQFLGSKIEDFTYTLYQSAP